MIEGRTLSVKDFDKTERYRTPIELALSKAKVGVNSAKRVTHRPLWVISISEFGSTKANVISTRAHPGIGSKMVYE